MVKRKGGTQLSEQLRRIILDGEMSRYELAKRSHVDASQLCRFVHGRGEMTFRTLDRIGEVLGLSFVKGGMK